MRLFHLRRCRWAWQGWDVGTGWSGQLQPAEEATKNNKLIEPFSCCPTNKKEGEGVYRGFALKTNRYCTQMTQSYVVSCCENWERIGGVGLPRRKRLVQVRQLTESALYALHMAPCLPGARSGPHSCTTTNTYSTSAQTRTDKQQKERNFSTIYYWLLWI